VIRRAGPAIACISSPTASRSRRQPTPFRLATGSFFGEPCVTRRFGPQRQCGDDAALDAFDPRSRRFPYANGPHPELARAIDAEGKRRVSENQRLRELQVQTARRRPAEWFKRRADRRSDLDASPGMTDQGGAPSSTCFGVTTSAACTESQRARQRRVPRQAPIRSVDRAAASSAAFHQPGAEAGKSSIAGQRCNGLARPCRCLLHDRGFHT